MKNDNSKTPYDSYLESLERMRKSLMPLTKTLSEMTLDTSALIGAAGLMSSRMAELWKGYENVDISKSASAVLKAAYTPFEVSESYKQSMESFKEIGRQFSVQIPLHRITDSASNGSVFPVVTEHFSASSDHAFL